MSSGSTGDNVTRREFVRTTAAASASILAGPALNSAWARGDDTLRVGLIGCGGRGAGAASQALNADAGVVIWAMGDAFDDRLQTSLGNLRGHEASDRVQVSEARQFVGFDAYEKVIASDIDVVILATPPHFRPAHMKAAVAANVHVFTEKPMAVDAQGVRTVLASAADAKAKNLAIVSGFCWRYNAPERATYARIHDGAIGDVASMHATYHTGPIGTHPRQPEWSDMEWQLRNWHHFTWLSGDHLVEQACHSVDKINWAMNGVMPVKAVALGGRGLRHLPEHGNSYDHFTVIYEYDNGVRTFLTCRQQANCLIDNSDYITGTKGQCVVNGWAPRHDITGENPWSYDGPRTNMYQVEHDELFASIRAGKPINDGEWMSNSTMMAVLGRMAAYTGQEITWDQAMQSQAVLGPSDYAFGELAVPPISRPGETPFV